MNTTFKERKRSAEWALYYIDKISEKFIYKVKNLTKPTDEFKILILDKIHSYDSIGIKMAVKTFNRKGYNMKLSKYRKVSDDRYAYIFALSKMS